VDRSVHLPAGGAKEAGHSCPATSARIRNGRWKCRWTGVSTFRQGGQRRRDTLVPQLSSGACPQARTLTQVSETAGSLPVDTRLPGKFAPFALPLGDRTAFRQAQDLQQAVPTPLPPPWSGALDSAKLVERRWLPLDRGGPVVSDTNNRQERLRFPLAGTPRVH